MEDRMRTNLKRFERGAEKSAALAEGMLKLAFIDVDLKNSELIFEQKEFDEASFAENFVVKSGSWTTEDGWAVGKKSRYVPGYDHFQKGFLW